VSSKVRLTLTITGAVLALDQLTKIWVDQAIPLYESIDLVPSFVNLTYVRNTGAAFSFLAGTRSVLRLGFFVLISLVAIGCIFYLLRNLRPEQRTFTASLALILGGAVGNLIDRARLGEVIDFIDLHWYDLHWPVFNVADSAITGGVLLIFLEMARKRSLSL
jgi:signal peptidase II